MQESSTIVAVATAAGPGAIAIVRMSGVDSIAIASRVFIPKFFLGPEGLLQADSHRAFFGSVNDPESGRPMDSVLCTIMRAPRSYTGEDVVEISCHGSPAVAEGLTNLCCRLGARLARPGEFTRRALQNGRLDLAQAEAVLDLVSARTDLAARAAAEKLSGSLSEKISSISGDICGMLAQVEACLDFPEETPEPEAQLFADRLYEQGTKPIKDLVGLFSDGEVLRNGIYTSIAGRPNAGKSSLLNAFIGRDRALVTDVAGTTRDVVEESVIVNGRLFVLADTAGISGNPDRLEALGMERSRKAILKARLVLFVVDACCFSGADEARLVEAECGDKTAIVLANKADIAGEEALRDVEIAFPGRPVLRISAFTGYNLDALRDLIDKMVAAPSEEAFLGPNIRQKIALEKAAQKIENSAENTLSLSWDLVAEDLREALLFLGEITGKNVSSEVLDRIFSQFCIGK